MRIISQVVLAVITGLNTAIPLILDAQQLFPSWPWQMHALIGFAAFVAVMVWIVLSYSIPLHKIEKSKPNIIFQQAKDWQFYRTDAIYGVLQIWFQNTPKVSSGTSIAEKVTAKVKFYDLNTKEKRENSGCFIKAESMDWAGNIERFEIIDTWAPNDEPRKLQIALRWANEDKAYRFIYNTPEDGRMENMELPKGTYLLRVSFSGVRVAQPPLWFKLVNPGQGVKNPFLAATHIKKPNLRKAGFQTE